MNKLSRGLFNKEIAEDLGISLDTVKSHLKNIYSKFGVANRFDAIDKFHSLSAGKLQLPSKT